MTIPPTDSAGVPWAGRSFASHPPSTDDGSAPELLVGALDRFRRGVGSQIEVVEAVRSSRLLVPLVAELAERGVGRAGQAVDKSADLGIVTVAAPDGRRALVVFSSVDAMKTWNADARPIPSDAVRVALAASDEGSEIVVLDPGSSTEFVIRRPAIWALAQGIPWMPSYLDEEVLAAFMAAAEPEPDISGVMLDAGDAPARFTGPELAVTVAIRPGLDRSALDEVLARFSARIAATELVATRVDSLALRIVSATDGGHPL